ncbi:hypothetical protein O1611_g10327 [Lasiodiplodia mahajangana]|uniref:Uncharacterized protein n=1 Tax=Lasiodiplodia mahajangana TaxID=1108764 RepID=A0ACC2IZE8_9PEZI|nr:hypothetical protein O1611_g10327 [Lasiodiplodia mahajangana]
MTSLCASLELFELAGGMLPLRERSKRLTAFLEKCISSMSDEAKKLFRTITPPDPDQRGAQLSLLLEDGLLDATMHGLEEHGVIIDERKPNVIRVAPAPLYNNFQDCVSFVEAFEEAAAATPGSIFANQRQARYPKRLQGTSSAKAQAESTRDSRYDVDVVRPRQASKKLSIHHEFLEISLEKLGNAIKSLTHVVADVAVLKKTRLFQFIISGGHKQYRKQLLIKDKPTKSHTATKCHSSTPSTSEAGISARTSTLVAMAYIEDRGGSHSADSTASGPKYPRLYSPFCVAMTLLSRS